MEEVAMKKSRFSKSLIGSILKETENDRKGKDLCREHGISTACFYQWKSKYGGLEATDLNPLGELEGENNRLKKIDADQRVKSNLRQEVLGGGR
jgi:putative transposase